MEEAELNIRTFSEEELVELTREIAEEHGVSADVMLHIIENESQWNINARGDMNLICERNGLPVRARGLVQITECYYPEVTDAQADNPYFAIQFLAEKLAEGEETCRSQWSTCPL